MPTRKLSQARARARRRRSGAGAVMFIVAITLALLAAMGAYGLAATAADTQASGHMRQAAQAQHATEYAMMASAELFTPGTTKELVGQMNNATLRGGVKCTSTNNYVVGSGKVIPAQQCLSFSHDIDAEFNMANVAAQVNAYQPPLSATCGTPALCPFFNTDSFGGVTDQPYLHIEVTNPINIPVPAGNQISPANGPGGQTQMYTELAVAVYVDMKPSSTSAADTRTLATGRLIVGPYYPTSN